MWRPLLLVAAALALLAAGVWQQRERLVLGHLAGKAQKSTLAERVGMLRPHIIYIEPEGVAPPWPAVALLHGCAGMRLNFMEQWAKAAAAEGYLAAIIDSTTPRGIDRARAVGEICAGKALIGQERAGDALAAVEILRQRNDVDAGKIVLAGWSHGAWTAMDLIAMTPPRRMPAGLSRDGVEPPDIAGAVLIYPYCGPGAWSRLDGWRKPPPALMLVAAKDTIVDPAACPALVKSLHETGADVELVVYPEADHVFDDPFLEPEYIHLYDAATHADAERRVRAFLREIAAR